MATYLDKIVEYKKQELDFVRRRVSQKDVELKAADSSKTRPFLKNFKDGQVNIIAEIKKSSPSLGLIRSDFKPLDIAAIYQDAGACALSVLTDENFFSGSLSILENVRESVEIPCLRKDFTLHHYHVYEARAHGADAILLIAAILEPAQLKDFSDLAYEMGMTTLFEIHNENDWNKIKDISPQLVGVNNRDLQTFQTSLQTSVKLFPLLQSVPTCISESGLKNHSEVDELRQIGFRGFLIGETFMREKNIAHKFDELMGRKE